MTTWTDGPDGALVARAGEAEIAVLATGAGIAAVNTPKPYLHPIRTPGGVVVTGFEPEDHRWHHGLMLAMPRVDDRHNLWGGGTYLDPERGYQDVENQGAIVHLGWSEATEGPTAAVTEAVRWDGHDARPLLHEVRRWAITAGGPDHVIDLDTTLRSATGADVALGTPAQNGRPDGGYGGLFLRLTEDFTLDAIEGDPGTDVAESGGVSDTLVVHGHTGGAPVTLGLAFVEGPGTRSWLHRFAPFVSIGWAIAYDEGLTVPAGGELRLRHRLIVGDGHRDPAAVRDRLSGAPSNA